MAVLRQMFCLEKKDKPNIFIKESFLTERDMRALKPVLASYYFLPFQGGSSFLFTLLIVCDVSLDDVSTICMCTGV